MDAGNQGSLGRNPNRGDWRRLAVHFRRFRRLSGEILAILDDIIRDDKRAGEVIRSLLTLLENSPMPREPHSPNELVTLVGAVLGKELAIAGIELQLDLPADRGGPRRQSPSVQR